MFTATPPNAVGVFIKQLYLRYPKQPNALFSGLDFTLLPAHTTCLLGRSGCGKSSLLKVLANLLELDSKHLHGQMTASDNLTLKGRVSYMAQQDLLFPWLNVLNNVALQSKLQQGHLNNQQKQKAQALLEELGLSDVASALPHELSGGMRQRVALARTLMQDTPIVLMDEPFSALDAVTRYQMQQLAANVLSGKTCLLITHDPQEALILGDDLYLMHKDSVTSCAQIKSLPTPSCLTPREVNAQLGEYQAQLFAELEAKYAIQY